MFCVWLFDSSNNMVKEFDDCIGMCVLSEETMLSEFPDIVDAMGFSCPYFHIIDSHGEHFYPLYVYSVLVG